MDKNDIEKYKKIIRGCNKVIKLNSKDYEAFNNRGSAKGILGQYEEAIKDYDEAIELNPKFGKAFNNRGSAKNDLKQHKEAIKDYGKAIKLNPKYDKAFYNRGSAKDDLGQYEEAIKDYDEAIELNPKYGKAFNNRGYAKYNLGQYEEAIKDYSKAIELNSKYDLAIQNKTKSKKALEEQKKLEKQSKISNEQFLKEIEKLKKENIESAKKQSDAIKKDLKKEIEELATSQTIEVKGENLKKLLEEYKEQKQPLLDTQQKFSKYIMIALIILIGLGIYITGFNKETSIFLLLPITLSSFFIISPLFWILKDNMKAIQDNHKIILHLQEKYFLLVNMRYVDKDYTDKIMDYFMQNKATDLLDNKKSNNQLAGLKESIDMVKSLKDITDKK